MLFRSRQHEAVGWNRVIRYRILIALYFGKQRITRHRNASDAVKALSGEPLHLLLPALVKIDTIRRHECKRIKSHTALCSDSRIKLPYRSRTKVSRIFVSLIGFQYPRRIMGHKKLKKFTENETFSCRSGAACAGWHGPAGWS